MAQPSPVKPGDFILSNSMSFGRPYVMATERGFMTAVASSRRVQPIESRFPLPHPPGFETGLRSVREVSNCGAGVRSISTASLSETKRIPLPPLDVQTEIVTEIEDYQKAIDGARRLFYDDPDIPIHSEWPVIELGRNLFLQEWASTSPKAHRVRYAVKIIGVSNFQNNLDAPLRDLDESF